MMLTLLSFAVSSPARADGPGSGHRRPGAQQSNRSAPKAAKVDLQLLVVHATDSHERVDPKLKALTRYLSHLRFTGYELLETHRVHIGAHGEDSFTIAGDRKVYIEVLSKDERRVRLRVQIKGKGGKLLDTTLSVNRNGTFIVAGPRYKGGILVLPLTARY